MSEETRPRGRAVAEKATIQFLTLPDGSKRRVASRPIGDPELILSWVTEEAADNPERWFDLRDLYRFVYLGEPMRMRHVRRTLRGFLRRARSFAISHGTIISVRTDSQGGVTHFKLLKRTSITEMKAALESAARDLEMEYAFDRRVVNQCDTLETDVSQLHGILEARLVE